MWCSSKRFRIIEGKNATEIDATVSIAGRHIYPQRTCLLHIYVDQYLWEEVFNKEGAKNYPRYA